MKDFCLRFNNKDQMLAVLQQISMTYIDDEGNEQSCKGNHQYVLWEVGEIYGIDGWHVNIRVIDPNMELSTLEPYRVFPRKPVCVWA